MSETLGEKPVEENEKPLYTDSQLVQWAVDVLKNHGLTKRPDMIWRLEQMTERLRAQSVAASQQPAEPRFTLEEIEQAVLRVAGLTSEQLQNPTCPPAITHLAKSFWSRVKHCLQESRR